MKARENEIACAAALAYLKTVPAGTVDCCVTSPPYFGLRDYGIGPVSWPAVSYLALPGSTRGVRVPAQSAVLGLEAELEHYVGHLVQVLRAVRRTLKPGGTVWLNLGDSYATRPNGPAPGVSGLQGHKEPPHAQARLAHALRKKRVPHGLQHKDLMGVPWRAAFALQADGWILRSDIVWAKPNAMPEPVEDRPTCMHEHIFLLANGPQYYFGQRDLEEPAVTTRPELLTFGARPAVGYPGGCQDRRRARPERKQDDHENRTVRGFNERWDRKEADGQIPGTRNVRNVWSVATSRYGGAHFATMPEAVARRCVLGGAPEGGVVLDPFCGAATVPLLAVELGRRFYACEMNAEYVAMGSERIAQRAGVLWARSVD